MYKLVILIEPLEDWLAFDEGWPEFLARAENMPGLLSETTSRVDSLIHGHFHVAMIHELYFDTMEAARAAIRRACIAPRGSTSAACTTNSCSAASSEGSTR